MDFAERIRELANRLEGQLPNIQTEEATKHALVMPFITALGYDVFNPSEVTPELNADVGVKKGEKVDYAILRDGKPIILFECKWHKSDLAKAHASQLYRYFSVTEARFGVLTNGIHYWFYSDLDAPNKMDQKPFFQFNILDYRDAEIEELKKFGKSAFDLDRILTTASELKYTNAIKRIFEQQLQSPSEEFVRFFTSQVYQGRMTAGVREQFRETTKRAFRLFLNEWVNQRLQSALTNETPQVQEVPQTANTPLIQPEETLSSVVTTTEEVEAFYTIKAILHPEVSSKRIVMRDVQSYCGILLDDNNRKPLCRLYFSQTRLVIGLFDGEGRAEQRIRIAEVEDIHTYADRLRNTLRHYETMSTKVGGDS